MEKNEDIVRKVTRTRGNIRNGIGVPTKKHSPRWGATGAGMEWGRGRGGNKNEGKHTGSGPDRD